MTWYKVLVLTCVFGFHQLTGWGQAPSFSKLSVEDGLSNNHVNVIYQDSYGYIWIGTLGGIDRYDGVEIKSFSYRFPGYEETVNTITEDIYRTLWVGTTTGLFHYNPGSDFFERIQIDSSKITVNALAFLPDSNLLVGTADGLYLVHTESMEAEKLQLSGLPENQRINITGIFPDNHGNCWLSSSKGLYRYSFSDKGSEIFRYELFPQAAYNSFSSICNIGNKLYLGTTSVGIIEFDLHTKVFSRGVSTDNKIILNLTSDGKEYIFAGTDGGGLHVINVRTREVTNYVNQENNEESLCSNSVYAFFLDDEGRYWVGTYSAGLCFARNIAERFQLHPLTINYPDINKSIRSFYFSPDGSQYFGTRNGFVHLSEQGDLNHFISTPGDTSGLRSNIILSVFPYMGDILIGTYGGGLSRYSVSEKDIQDFLADPGLSQGNIYAFERDNYGALWFTSFNGLYRYSPSENSLVNFSTLNSALDNDQVFEITFDSEGRLWVGTMSGAYAYIYQNNRLEKIDVSLIEDNSYKTNFIYEDQVGNIWICTETGGLIMLDPRLTQSKNFRNVNGLPDNSVCAIIEGRTGEYWISTLKGFCKYSHQSDEFARYRISDGLPGLVFTPAATYLAPDGTIFFGNENGLVHFTPDDLDASNLSSRVRITDFYLSGQEVKPGKNSALKQVIEECQVIRINDGSNNIGFRFVTLNYFNPADNHYQYLLEGYDQEWINSGSNNRVYYQDLKKGNYLFKVRNANVSERQAQSHAEIRIVIQNRILEYFNFFTILLLLFIVGIFVMIRYKAKLPAAVRNVVGLDLKNEKYKGSRIPKDQGEQVISELTRYMENEKPYLNAELKIADLADHVHHPIHEISQILNQHLNQSFHDYVNKYRVNEVKKLMKDEAYEKFTLYALAQQSGFNSKTSFYRIFKNETGKTPADYMKELSDQKQPK